jgi:serine/threonine-protein kinase
VLSPQYTNFANSSLTQTIFEIPALIQNILQYSVDLLIIIGFAITAGLLIVNRSDDWFAIFISMFLIVFGARITNLVNTIAITPGYETLGGAILAMGDIGIVLFLMLFPDGTFVPRWLKYLVPFLVITVTSIYLFPSLPTFWVTIGDSLYVFIMLFWYVLGSLVLSYRYRYSTLAQRQQMRWVSIGTLGPLLWFVLFVVAPSFIPILSSSTFIAAAFILISRVFSIFLFLLLPFSITISIVRSKLFDIDLIINRSIVYGVLTVGLGLTFALLFALVSLIANFIQQNDQSFFVATVFAVAAGALFQPMRKKLQRFVDRAIYHIQIEYDKTPVEARDTSQTIITGTTLSSYHELKMIGRGGMAEVYRAESPTNHKPVAIKVLRASLAGEEQFRKRFMREAEVVAGLEHPNIVRVLDYGHENDAYYIVMELLSGPDVSNLLKEEKRLPLSRAVDLLRGISDALDYAHKNGLVHRDIKPSNIMLDSFTNPPRVVLTDFGIAKISDAHTKITNTGMVGTFDYIAPEQIQASAEVDGRADVYALGVMTYQMLTGQLPFQRPNTGALLLAHLNSPAPDAREITQELPRNAARAIQKAMAKEPQDRFRTAGEFIAQLSA